MQLLTIASFRYLPPIRDDFPGILCSQTHKTHCSASSYATIQWMSKEKKQEPLIIKRYGNRRLYNTSTKSYVNYEELLEIIREGEDIRVIDSKSKEDVTKAVLIQLILEEEKKDSSVLPTDFLFQAIRSRNSTMQDFFRDHLSASFEAYMKTKEQFDNQFRSVLEMAFQAPRTIEKLVPGAEVVREMVSGESDEEEDEGEEK